MKILVTGGAGFIGQRIVRGLLKRGHEIHVLGRSKRPREDNIHFHSIDLAKETIPAKVGENTEAVFHLAAKAGVWGSAASYHAANVIATRRILATCREHGVRTLVHTSSPSVVFTGEPFRGDAETLPYGHNWLCHYARTKAIAEQEILAVNGKSNLKTIALRPHLVWGPGDPHLVPKWVIGPVEREKHAGAQLPGDRQHHRRRPIVQRVLHLLTPRGPRRRIEMPPHFRAGIADDDNRGVGSVGHAGHPVIRARHEAAAADQSGAFQGGLHILIAHVLSSTCLSIARPGPAGISVALAQ